MDASVRRIGAAVGMMACCGLSMAVAVGLLAFTSSLVVVGLAAVIAIGCVVFMALPGQGHSHKLDHGNSGVPDKAA